MFKSEDEISNYQHAILKDRESNIADNIAMVVFSPERSDGSTESDLIEALKGKYDALKDKLLAEALMKEVCMDSIGTAICENRPLMTFGLLLCQIIIWKA